MSTRKRLGHTFLEELQVKLWWTNPVPVLELLDHLGLTSSSKSAGNIHGNVEIDGRRHENTRRSWVAATYNNKNQAPKKKHDQTEALLVQVYMQCIGINRPSIKVIHAIWQKFVYLCMCQKPSRYLLVTHRTSIPGSSIRRWLRNSSTVDGEAQVQTAWTLTT